ncbi:MAG: carboxypeptidase regulatory-like domain-containing protein, partial [Firmicutes bacterium]|nr:carboxypeptidase regulatory-like domain-containing protein [Bacillota bacterium]
MIKRYKYLFFLVLVAVVFTGCSVSVSSPGSVEGYVYIPTGYLAAQSSTELEPLFKAQAKPPVNYEPLVGANVRVVGRAERGKTDETGYFKISGLPAGHYRLRVSHPG